jgi:hypothetical protein
MAKIRISNSGMNRYSTCGASYKYHYIDGYRSNIKSSALFFGSAVDAGCNFMLENFSSRKDAGFLEQAIEIFHATWLQQYDKDSDTIVLLPKSPNIKYFKSDYDLDVLRPEDLTELGLDTEEAIKNYELGRASVDAALKENGGRWDLIPKEDRLDYNEVTWWCLLRKGYIMLKAYHEQILPEFKSIFFLQKPIQLLDEKGNIVNGIAEFGAELLDGRNCLVDNKTAGTPYEPESVAISQQLSLYERILNIQGEEDKFKDYPKIDCAAYAVMGKKIQKIKTKTCSSCGHVGQGSHKTCDNVINGRRCNNDWTTVTTLQGNTQFIIDNISEDFGNTVLENASTIVACVEKGIFPKNFNKCYDNYGGVCEFLHLCHKNDKTNIFKAIVQKDPNGEKKV